MTPGNITDDVSWCITWWCMLKVGSIVSLSLPEMHKISILGLLTIQLQSIHLR